MDLIKKTIKILFVVMALFFLISCQTNNNNYAVVFKDEDGSILKTEVVQHGNDATPLVISEKEGKIFINWDASYQKIIKDTVITAVYEAKTYKARFLKDGVEINSQNVKHGEAATPPQNKDKEGYTFTGYSEPLENIKKNTDINLEYEINKYEVKFYLGETLLKTDIVNYLETATPPEEPQKDNFIFDGWDTPFTNVTSNLVVKATYKPDPYTITFTGLTKEGVLSWNPVPGETRFDVKIDEYETGAYSNSISLSAGAIGVASRHTKVTVSVGEYRGVTYVDRYGNQDYSFSQGEAPLLQTPSGFRIVNQEVEGRVYYYLQFDRVVNDAPANRAPAYLIYYWDQSRVDQSQVAIADTRVSYLLTGLNWGPSSQTIKIVLRGYGEFGNSVAASIHIAKNSDGSFLITE